MRGLFGNRNQNADDDQDREEYTEGDENAQDDATEGDAEDDAEGESTDDAALQARIQEEARKIADEEVGKIRQAAQRRGLDWTGQDFGVTDYQRAQQAFGYLGQQQDREQPAATAPEDPEPEIEDWDTDSQKRHVAWQVRQATKPMAEENRRLQRLVIDSELSRAIDRVPDAIKRYAPHLEEILDHPEFGEQFRAAISTQAPELWADNRNLARVAAMLSVDLDREQIPKKEPAQDDGGRSTPGAQQRSQIGQILPTRGTGQPPEDDLSDGERRYIRMGRLNSPEEARALRQNADGITTFEGYERYLNKQKARSRK